MGLVALLVCNVRLHMCTTDTVFGGSKLAICLGEVGWGEWARLCLCCGYDCDCVGHTIPYERLDDLYDSTNFTRCKTSNPPL